MPRGSRIWLELGFLVEGPPRGVGEESGADLRAEVVESRAFQSARQAVDSP